VPGRPGPFITDFDSTTGTVSPALMHLVAAVAVAVVLGLAAVAKSSDSIAR
jgi:hypothetical protein